MAEAVESEDGLQPSNKKARIESINCIRPRVIRVQTQFDRHRSLLSKAVEQINSDWASFCFVRILNCNADQSFSFIGAYCKSVRNFQEADVSKHLVTWIPDLFDVELIQRFLEEEIEFENDMLDKQLTAFEKLAQFFDTMSVCNNVLEEQLENEALTEGQWAIIIATHILRKLAVYNQIKIESGNSNLPQDQECPCGCKASITVGDNSMGHKEVWNGSVDILLGSVGVATAKARNEDELSEECSSAFEQKRSKLEDARQQLIAESIVLSFAMRSGVVPLIGLSKDSFKVFMYDPEEDLLFESTNMPLFDEPVSVDGRQLNISSLVTLWIVINFDQFFTGVKSKHVEFDYKANLRKFLDARQYEIYQQQMKIGGLRNVKSKSVEYNAGGNVGKFGRL